MNCTICERPIEDGEPRKRVAASRPSGGILPATYAHKRCRKQPATVVPFIASWSAELVDEQPVVFRPLVGGIGYSAETATDRDDRGVLWLRRRDARGEGGPRYSIVHPGRQRLCMLRLLCQVCGEPADRDDRGVLWLVEDSRGDYPTWPEDMLTTHPPICLPCLQTSREQCPHLWAGSVALRVGRSDVFAVYGRRYTLGRLGPLPVEADIVAFESALIRWTLASQLVRALNDCTIVSSEELAARP